MPRLAFLLAAAATILGFAPATLVQARVADQIITPITTPLVPPPPTPFSGFPVARPRPLGSRRACRPFPVLRA